MSDSSGANTSERQSRLEQLLAEFLLSVELGRPLDRQALIAADPRSGGR